jgi:ABC-2 type transport system permease protein
MFLQTFPFSLSPSLHSSLIMLSEIIKFEWAYRKGRPATWIYFALIFILPIILVTTDSIKIVGGGEQTKENAPQAIAFTMIAFSYLFMMITSAVMGVAVLRDFEFNTEALMFSTPIKKFDYLFGRFFGSFLVLILIFSAMIVSFSIGEFLPSRDATKLLPYSLWHYIQPFLILVLPNLFFTGAFFFAGGALTRKSVIIYTQGIVLFVFYSIAQNLMGDIENREMGALLDPFGIRTFAYVTRYWTPAQKNMMTVPLEGVLFYNRLIWTGVGVLVLSITYFGFSFNVVRSGFFKKKAIVEDKQPKIKPELVAIPLVTQHLNTWTVVQQTLKNAWFYAKMSIRELPFLTIVIAGICLLISSLINAQETFGVKSIPNTASVLDSLGSFEPFLYALALTYAGELLWKERVVKFNLINDAMPVPDFVGILSKFLAMIIIYAGIFAVLILVGISVQAMKGYTNFQLPIYIEHFYVGKMVTMILYTMLFFFIQVLVNDKFVGIAISILFLIVQMVWSYLGFEHNMITFGSGDLGTFSDMNLYGHFVNSFSWLSIYWLGFAMIIFAIATTLSVRGTEELLKTRWFMSRHRFTKPIATFSILALITFTLSGCYVYYNTNVLEKYENSKTREKGQALYEKTLKAKYEFMNQPKIVESDIKVELYPSKRSMSADGFYYLKNKSTQTINDVFITFNKPVDVKELSFSGGSKVKQQWKDWGVTIYTLAKPLAPQDSVKMAFKVAVDSKSFLSGVAGRSLVYNGTFFNNTDYFPSIGYEEGGELSGEDERKKQGLKPKERMMEQTDKRGLSQNLFGDDADWIRFQMTIGTEPDQTAIAPGYLQKTYQEGNRKYFSYKMDRPMGNFYSIVSARYEVMKDKWKDVNLEIYYNKGHDKNLGKMMYGLKKSLEYYSKSFSPYQFRQMRIMEFPKYASFAQSFANTVPFSEGIGFVLDVKEKDPNIPFYVTAHEMGHQWWGHQVTEANVKGNAMLSESMSEYSALMVMKHNTKPEVMQKFMELNLDRYLYGRSSEIKKEMPLSQVESQSYIHYNKGSLCMYALQDYIGEDAINSALSQYIKDWQYPGPDHPKGRYPTSTDLIGYLRTATPDSLKYLIKDMFETITLYENKVEKAEYVQNKDKTFEVTLTLNSEKFRADSSGNQASIKLNEWIDVGVYGKDAKGEDKLLYLKKHHFTKKDNILKIKVKEEPTKAGIDPINILIDRHSSDNVKVLSKKEGV